MNDFDSENYNQDNSSMWVNPILQTKRGKIISIIGFLPMVFGLPIVLKKFRWDDFDFIEKFLILFEILVLVFSICYVICIRIKNKMKIKSLEKRSFKKIDFSYYRDILDEMSVGSLSYCYNEKINYKDIIVSLLLVLEKNRYIKFDMLGKRIVFLTDNTSNFNEHEKYFYSLIYKKDFITFKEIKNIITDDMFKGNFINLIKKDVKKSNYFTTKNFSKNVLSYLLFVNAIIMFAYIVITDLKNPIIFMVYFLGLLILFGLAYIEQKNVYIKTKRGMDIYGKLQGLKSYITDFSMLNERSVKELILWDYYMIYAIIFDLKGKLNDEVKEFYNMISI